MNYENSLLFGRNASVINEAYSNMYSNKNNKLNKRHLMKNGTKMLSESVDQENVDQDDKNMDAMDDHDFVFSYSKYDDRLRKKYPEWLIAAAKAAGHELDASGDIPTTYAGHGAKAVKLTKDDDDEESNEVVDNGTPWDNLYDNIIVAHPEVFNNERYDMNELPKHKKEFAEKWENFFVNGVGEIKSAERALEEIPGCECKVKEDEFIGNIDDEEDGVEADYEDNYPPIKSVWDRTGFGVIVKTYERDYSPESRSMKFVARYITPPQLKGITFDTKEEAIEELRNYMTELVGDPSEVCIGVVLDNEITNRIFKGDDYDVMKDENGNVVTYSSGPMAGKPKKVKIDSQVYAISSSDKENTDRILSYESSNWGSGRQEKNKCDEYLQ